MEKIRNIIYFCKKKVSMDIKTVAVYHCALTSKFGTPRQSGIVPGLKGEVEMAGEYRNPEYLRGLEGFDYIWLLWLFSANSHASSGSTVRPPLLGGNRSLGVFSTRSPYRPNPIGLSSVRLLDIGTSSTGVPVLHVEGADLIDGTPIIDIKPYLEYADSHQGVRSGFVDTHPWPRLDVRFSPQAMSLLTAGDMQLLRSLLEQDPRPHYHSDEMRIYGMPFDGRDVKFRVENNVLTVVDVV